MLSDKSTSLAIADKIAFVIDAAASELFATLSGDRNPLHIDPVRARRTIFGGTVCHGVHVVLTALERIVSGGSDGIVELRARFQRPVITGSTVTLGEIATKVDGSREVSINVDGETVIAMRFVSAPPFTGPSIELVRIAETANDLDFDAAAAATGRENAGYDTALAARMFPVLAARAPALLSSALAATRVVGMRCPGLHSLFVSLEIRANAHPPEEFGWRTTRASKALSMLWIELSAANCIAKIEALIRPHQRDQDTYDEIRSHVPAGAFAGRTALVLGGARGLGETSAKILAAGGASVTVGYRIGVSDAERVVAEICAGGGRAEAVAFDVLHPTNLEFRAFDRLYYFAAPRIAPNHGAWRPELFAEFAGYFIDGLAATLACLGMPKIGVFYPSTCFIDTSERGFAEYCVAKAAGETYLAQAAAAGRLKYAAPRLPRLATDQTVAFAHQRIDVALPLDVLPPAILRAEAGF